MPFTFRTAIAAAVLLIARYASAQTCWRNVTCTGPTEASFPGPWQTGIYSPSSRRVAPTQVLSLATGQNISAWPADAHLQGNASALVFDFGVEVGGIVTVSYTANGQGQLGLAFTEAKNWIGLYSDSSNGKFQRGDGSLLASFTGSGDYKYTMPDPQLRGGFRYLTMFLLSNDTSSNINITDVSLEIGFEPTWSDLQAYQGYFHSSDEMLNRIWYAGAYTLQTNAVPVNTGRWVPTLPYGWANNGTMSKGDTVIVDGAKRDRAVWPGDMGIAVPATFYSLGGKLESVKNALQVMFDNQNKDGTLPEAGPPLLQQNSTTYNLWTLIGVYNYVLYTNDTQFLAGIWPQYNKAMERLYSDRYPSGLMNQTGTRDWARWQTGYNQSETQMIFYRALMTGSTLATWSGNVSLAADWTSRAEALRAATNQYCWDEGYGAFKDNATTTSLHPQDANSMAILFGVVDKSSNVTSRAQGISSRLTNNWTPIGAEAPELPENISPFISSFEIQAHLEINQTARALDLIRRSWGWYANHPNGTGSTVIEGYLINGTFGYRSSRGYGYDPSYVSHAHGWSAGPTTALTEYVLGLSITDRLGIKWKLAPQFGDLLHAQGGFTTGLGKFSAGWERTGDGGYMIWYNTPPGTEGDLVLPWYEGCSVIMAGDQVEIGSEATISVAGGNSSVTVVVRA